jgi:hypothetical protein
VDDVLRGAGLLPSSAAERRESFGLQKPPSPPEPKPAVPPAPAREATAPPPADPRQLEVTLASATQAADGKLVLVTTEGAVWRQSESQTIRWLPVQGDAMKIEKTTFGGFLCSLGKGTVFRCRRTR